MPQELELPHDAFAHGDFRPLVAIRVIGFWTDYTPHPSTGEPRERDMVEYALIGETPDRSINRNFVKHLVPKKPPRHENDTPSIAAWGRWQIIEPAYKAWKAGHSFEVTGTPLDSWSGITADQAKAIKLAGINSIEDLVTAPEQRINSIQLPHAAKIVERAKMFLENADRSKATAQLSSLADENKALKDELEELKGLVKEMASTKRKPGRPPKQPETEQDEADAA